MALPARPKQAVVTENTENIWFNINRLKWSNRLRDRDLCEILGLSGSELDQLQDSGKAPRIRSLVSLSEHFEVSLDELVRSRISIRKALRGRRVGSLALPERFAVAARSKVRTSYHIVNFLERRSRFRPIEQFLNQTEVPYGIFGDLGQEINIDFITELCDWLARNRLVTMNDLYLMGLNTYEVNKRSELAEKLSRFESLRELHLFQVSEFMNFFDKNARYRVKRLSNTHCTASWTHNPEVCESLKRDRISSRLVETYQLGVAASIPLFLGLPPSRVRVVSSIHAGAKETAFEIDFTEAFEALKRKRRIKLLAAKPTRGVMP
jgi:DNA-binding Xre family transcriptional regulator